MKAKFKHRTIVKDEVNGFTGMVTGICWYMTGCVQFLVTPTSLDKDGKPKEGLWIDEDRLAVVKKSKVKPAKSKAAPGGPQYNTPPTM